MKIKTIRQIRKCLNGNLAAYLAPLANPLGANISNGNACGPSRQNQGFQGGELDHLCKQSPEKLPFEKEDSLKISFSLSPKAKFKYHIKHLDIFKII